MRKLTWWVCAVVLSVACGDDSGKSDEGLGFDDGASAGETQTAVVERTTSASIQMKTGASLSIPAGAARARITVEMSRMPDRDVRAQAMKAPPMYRIASASYAVRPTDTQLDSLAQLSLPIARGERSRIKMMVLENEQDTTWEEIPSQQGATSLSVVADIIHFGVYALLELTDEGTADAQVVDASVRDTSVADTSVAPTGYSHPAGDYSGLIVRKLRDCNFVATDGRWSDSFADEVVTQPIDICYNDCAFALSCADFISLTAYCSSTPGDPPALAACTTQCFGRAKKFSCTSASGSTVMAVSCDGNGDCADGSDEVGCMLVTPTFKCATGTTPSDTERCDGSDDCADGSDEQNCPAAFQCTTGSETAPAKYVCDGTNDCADGSDEQQGCLKIACP